MNEPPLIDAQEFLTRVDFGMSAALDMGAPAAPATLPELAYRVGNIEADLKSQAAKDLAQCQQQRRLKLLQRQRRRPLRKRQTKPRKLQVLWLPTLRARLLLRNSA